MSDDIEQWLEQVHWDSDGLVPVIAQDAGTGRVLTLAWMNRDALKETLQRKQAVYYSRSRQRLWHKGETSGHVQDVTEVRLDCDADTLLLRVRQQGGIACHTGRESCFFLRLSGSGWLEADPVKKDPAQIYGND